MRPGVIVCSGNWPRDCANCSTIRKVEDSSLKKQHSNNLVTKNGSETAPVDQERIRVAVREILLAVGEDPDREGLCETPERVARMYAELFSGLHKDPRQLLEKTFTEKYNEMVTVNDIGFDSLCEHHLLPFMGQAHV